MAASQEAPDHIRAHPTESDHSDLHKLRSFSRRCESLLYRVTINLRESSS
jgi:hypothetical protein